MGDLKDIPVSLKEDHLLSLPISQMNPGVSLHSRGHGLYLQRPLQAIVVEYDDRAGRGKLHLFGVLKCFGIWMLGK